MDHAGLWWSALKANGVQTQALAPARRPRGSVRVAPRGVGQHAAPLVRPLPLRRQQRHRDRDGRDGRGSSRRRGATTPRGRSRARRTSTCSCARPHRDRGRHARRRRRRRRGRHARLHRADRHQRDHADGHPDRRPDQPPRVPLAAADDRPAPLRHGGGGHRRLARRDAEQPQRRRRRLRRRPRRSRAATRASPTRTTRTCWGDTANGSTGEAGPPCTIGEHLHRAGRARSTRVLPRGHQADTTTQRHASGWRVTRGIRDSSNRDSLWYLDATPVTIGQSIPLQVPDHADRAHLQGRHRIGVIIGGSNTSMAIRHRQRQRRRHARHAHSKVTLPIKGGYAALARRGRTDAETVAPVARRRPGRHRDRDRPTRPARRSRSRTPTATDNEDPNPAVTCTPASGTKFPIGTTS